MGLNNPTPRPRFLKQVYLSSVSAGRVKFLFFCGRYKKLCAIYTYHLSLYHPKAKHGTELPFLIEAKKEIFAFGGKTALSFS